MEEVLAEACCHQLHDPFPLSYCRHEIALPAHVGVELDVVAVLILALEEARRREECGRRLTPSREGFWRW